MLIGKESGKRRIIRRLSKGLLIARRMIYSSITPYVHMLYTAEDDTEHVELDFSGSRRRSEDIWGYDSFGVSDTYHSPSSTDQGRSGVFDSLQTGRKSWLVRVAGGSWCMISTPNVVR